MELHIQKCQQCGSRKMRNILVRDESQKVYVQCRDCEGLVARYILAGGGYYHAGKEFESFLRSIERDDEITTGRNLNEVFGHVKTSAEQEFDNVIKMMRQRYNDNTP